MNIEYRQMGGYEAFMDITLNGVEYTFYFNMKGYRARFALSNKDGVFWHFKETTDKQQIKSLKKALKDGFTIQTLFK